jgi:hypothetical protein
MHLDQDGNQGDNDMNAIATFTTYEPTEQDLLDLHADRVKEIFEMLSTRKARRAAYRGEFFEGGVDGLKRGDYLGTLYVMGDMAYVVTDEYGEFTGVAAVYQVAEVVKVGQYRVTANQTVEQWSAR